MWCLLIGYKYCKVLFSYQAILQKQRGITNVLLSFLTIQSHVLAIGAIL